MIVSCGRSVNMLICVCSPHPLHPHPALATAETVASSSRTPSARARHPAALLPATTVAAPHLAAAAAPHQAVAAVAAAVSNSASLSFTEYRWAETVFSCLD